MKLFEIKAEPEKIVGLEVKLILPGHYTSQRGSRMEYARKLVVEGVVKQVKTFGHTTFIDVVLECPVVDTYYNESFKCLPVMVSSDADLASKIIFK